MVWSIEVTEQAAKQIARLDRPVQQRIMAFLRERIATDESPRRIGQALAGSLVGLWRYRVGDYRLICQIDDGHVRVLVLTIGHRSDVYR